MKIRPDKEKAKALVKMADITFKRLKEIDIAKYPTNTLTDYYEIIHKQMEALASIEGNKMKGDGAHQKLIDHICKGYQLGEGKQRFLQELREYRNRISYEGFMIKEEFIIRNSARIEEIIEILKILLLKKL